MLICYGVLALIFALGITIWACLYYIVYVPIFDLSWKTGNCTIVKIRELEKTVWYEIDEESSYSTVEKSGYSIYTVFVENATAYIGQGFTCSSDDYEGAISYKDENEEFLYDYTDCRDDERCYPGEIAMPNWYCANSADSENFYIGRRLECKYSIKGDENAALFGYIREDGDYIEVLFKDEVYYPRTDYIALWVCVFGFMVVLPVLLCILGLPCLLDCCSSEGRKNIGEFLVLCTCGWCSEAERAKCLDCCDRFVCCKRKKRPRCLETYGDLFKPVTAPPVITWLFTVRKVSSLQGMKPNLVHEVADFLAS